MRDDDELYIQGLSCVDKAVDDVLDKLMEVADVHDFQYEWVIEHFRMRFNSKAKTVLQE